MSKLKIGDNLYRYTGVSIMEYVVDAVVKRSVGTLYEIRSLSCKDHEACTLLVAESKSNHGFRFIDMLSQHDQEYWHTDYDPYQRYELTRDMAIVRRNESFIESSKESIQRLRESIAKQEINIKKAQGIIDGLTPQPQTKPQADKENNG